MTICKKGGQLNQVFNNLVKNAIEAIYEKGRLGNEMITIQTYYDGANTIIKIKDTGVGMTEETKEKLFDKYYTTKDPGKGTGLGMGIVKNIINDYGGSIAVVSELGKGTEFIITLPASPEYQQDTE